MIVIVNPVDSVAGAMVCCLGFGALSGLIAFTAIRSVIGDARAGREADRVVLFIAVLFLVLCLAFGFILFKLVQLGGADAG